MIHRVLYNTPSNIGDVIMTLPCLEVLKGNFPQARVMVMTSPRVYDLFAGSRFASEIAIYDKHAALIDKINLVRQLRGYDFDLVVDFKNSLIPYLVPHHYRTPLLRAKFKSILLKREQNLACLKAAVKDLPMDWSKTAPFDFYRAEDEISVKAKLALQGKNDGSWIAITPGALSREKRWSEKKFSRLIDGLTLEQRKNIVLAGSPADAEIAARIEEMCSVKVFNLCGQTTLRELAALFAIAELVISNDSAPLQMAYSMKIPAVGIFGPTNHKKFGMENEISAIVRAPLPESGVDYNSNILDARPESIHQVSDEMVYAACLRILKAKEKGTHAPA